MADSNTKAASLAALAAAHGCDVECEDTGRLLTCRDCAEQSDAPVKETDRG